MRERLLALLAYLEQFSTEERAKAQLFDDLIQWLSDADSENFVEHYCTHWDIDTEEF